MGDAAIALNRFGLGARPDDPVPADPRRWLRDQLTSFNPSPAALAEQPGSTSLLGELATARMERKDFKQDKAASPEKAEGAGFFHDLRDAYIGAVGARTDAALSSDTPFVERLVHFWSNHFAVSVDKVATVGLAGAFEFEAIRPHVLGRFSDLLNAVERHPAMLLYLDQAQSIGPDSRAGERAARNGRKRGINENLAREIMELHTLGVRTGYDQADVTEFARALTGWTLAGLGNQRFLQGLPPGFAFVDVLHEPGTRTIMGRRYGQAGEAQAQAVLDDLAVHPATARHIATKLARHFAADDPPPALITRLEQAFIASGGDLPTVYRALIDAPEPWTVPDAKFRTPWEWGIGALRASGVPSLPPKMAVGAFQQLGQVIWKPGSPAGYDDIAASWAGPDALLRRVEMAQRIAQRAAFSGDPRELAAQLFPEALSPTTRTAIARAESARQGLALLLAAPEMMRR